MTAQTFCPNCGAARVPGTRFCGSCGRAFDGATPVDGGSVAASTIASPSGTPALLAGLSWLIAAALTAYLAYQQWSLSQQLGSLGLDDEGLGGYAAWNAVTAVITLYFGARVLTKPTRYLLGASVVWAVLTVASGLLQVGSGGTNDIFVFTVIASAAAGVLSFVARQGTPDAIAAPEPKTSQVVGWQQPVAPSAPSSGSTGFAAISPSALEAKPASNSRTAERVVIALIVLAVLVGGALLISKMQVDQIMADVASSIPTSRPATPRPATPVPADASTAGFGEPIDLIDGNGADLGTVKVIKSGKPSELLGSGPTAGYRYIAAQVSYAARAAWSYNLFDWAAHDSRQFQYEPLGYAPNPPLNYGELSTGRQVEGWVAFEVPDNVRDVWLDFQSGDGTVIFSVKID